MITTLIIAAALATVILWVNPRNLSMRWLSVSMYVASLMISVYLVDLRYANASHYLINHLFFITDIALAFTFGMFGVVYSELLNKRYRGRLMLLCFILIAIAYMLTPLSPTRRINYDGNNELPVIIFIALLLSLGILFLIVAYMKEKQPYKRIERLLTNLLIIPTMVSILCSYLFFINNFNLFQYNYVFAIGFLVIFFIIGLKQGALGVRIKIAMLKADASLHLLKGSTGFINHTIKNEIGKIDILLYQIKHTLQQPQLTFDGSDKNEVEGMLTMASASVQHMQTMMTRVNERVQDIVVNPQLNNLTVLTTECLASLKPSIGDKVTIITYFNAIPQLLLDHIHIREVLTNVLMNAVEAMDYEGVITVSIGDQGSKVLLQIQDTGHGISKEARSSIFEPFYSTKQLKDHYGLGLFYCNNVMNKHNGSIHIRNNSSIGCTVYIHFAK